MTSSTDFNLTDPKTEKKLKSTKGLWLVNWCNVLWVIATNWTMMGIDIVLQYRCSHRDMSVKTG